jgi:hypothetical protein
VKLFKACGRFKVMIATAPCSAYKTAGFDIRVFLGWLQIYHRTRGSETLPGI